jgi:hypothetical protein
MKREIIEKNGRKVSKITFEGEEGYVIIDKNIVEHYSNGFLIRRFETMNPILFTSDLINSQVSKSPEARDT